MCLSDSTPSLFADDTNVTVTGNSIQDIESKLNGELNNLYHENNISWKYFVYI